MRADVSSGGGTVAQGVRGLSDGPPGPGVAVLPDVRGLHGFYEEALRFAERGHPAVAFDYFGRTAGAEKRDAGLRRAPRLI
jgi:carboxymethylenebutenolidase